MTLPRSAAEVLADHVVWELECIDRMYLNLYVPKLMFANGIGLLLPATPGARVRLVGADGPDD